MQWWFQPLTVMSLLARVTSGYVRASLCATGQLLNRSREATSRDQWKRSETSDLEVSVTNVNGQKVRQ